jgi:hypothetical protein
MVAIGCTLNGTNNDAGVAIFNTKTEAWAP